MNIKNTVPYKVLKQIAGTCKHKGYNLIGKIGTKIDNNMILFMTQQGSYTCNPRAICDEIINSKKPYKLVWAVNKNNLQTEELRLQYPKEVKIVLKGTIAFYRALNSAKIMIENEHNVGRRWQYKKKKKQFILDTWHGSMGLKRIAIDNCLSAHYVINKNIKYQKQTDYIISNSKFENEIYRSTYWPNNEILEYGHARNDILFKNKESKEIKLLNKKVRQFLKIKDNDKIFLYAPTFRDKNSNITSNIKLDYEKIKKALENKFGGSWKIVVRFHHKEIKLHPTYAKDNNVIDATLYPDMQELLSVIDIGVTDYSSWICDYVLTKKPGFLFTPDIEEYQKIDRGFYYPLEETPFPISKSCKELIASINNFDIKKYKEKVDKFLELRGCFEDGHACERIIKLIDKIMNNSDKLN